jgi:hypothetical protein
LLLAQPVIYNAAGTLDQGETTTLTGNNFGEGATILTWDDFETGTVGNTIIGEDPIIGHEWSCFEWRYHGDNEHDVTYDSRFSYSGGKAARWWLKNYSTLAFGWKNKGPYRELYFSYWRFNYPRNGGQYEYGIWDPSPGPPDYKYFNFKGSFTFGHTGPNGQGPQTYLGAIRVPYPYHQYSVQNSGTESFKIGDPQPRVRWSEGIGTWRKFERWLKNESHQDANDAAGQLAVNNQLLVDESNINLTTYADSWTRDWRLGYMQQSFAYFDTFMTWFDDIYCADSRARVELGSHRQFADCTRRDIQPHVEWNGTSIDVVIHTPSFSSGETAYLFVIDANGDPSDGYQVTVGDTIEPPPPDSSPPTVSIVDPSLPTEGEFPFHISISGSATDNMGIAYVTWDNSLGGSGLAQGTTSWSISDLQIYAGDNVITVNAYDTAGNRGSEQVTIPWDYPGSPGEPKITP